MEDLSEQYIKLKEELDDKDAIKRYVRLKDEMDSVKIEDILFQEEIVEDVEEIVEEDEEIIEKIIDKEPIKKYIQIKLELDAIKKENRIRAEEDEKRRDEKALEDKKRREEKTLGQMESLFSSLKEKEKQVVKELEITEEIINEKVEEKPFPSYESVVNVISKQESIKEKTELQEQPADSVSARIEKLEKWIRKIAGAGAGSGEVRLLNLDDVNTTDLANDKILKYQSSSGKFVFASASSGSGHTLQNAGSDLTARTNLNFDGTYVIATDDSGNDQTDITLHASLLGSTSATSTTLVDADRVVVNDNGTMKQVALTDFETYFESALDTTSNITTVGALDSGSITSGFGTIDTGSSAITTTGTVTGGTLTGTLSTAAQGNITSLGTLTSLAVDNIIINGTNIGHTSDTDAISIASSGNVTISQDLAVSGALTISGGTTKIESTVTTVVDPIIHLQTASGGGALGSDTNKDVGLALQYHTGSAAKTAFLGYDDSAGKLTFIPDATLSSEVVSGTAGTIVAELEGNSTTATALETGRTIGMTGDVVWTSESFTGSGNVTGVATIQAGAVENSMLADDAVGADELASNSVVNASVASGAAIALSKLATTTSSRVLETSGTGVISASDITTTELALLDGSSAGSIVNSKAVIYSGTGTIAGTLSTAAQGNITSLGTLTTLTIDNVLINGATIGHTDDTDLITVADGLVTVAGELQATTLDIGGTNITATATEINRLDGIGSTAVGITDYQTLSNKTISTLTATGADHTITDTTTGSSAGPVLELVRDRTGADANYIGQIKFSADNDANSKQIFAKISGKIGDASDSSEDGVIEIAQMKAGSQNIGVRIASNKFSILNGVDFDVNTHDGSSVGLKLGGTLVTSTAAELNRLDGIESTAVGLTDSQTMTNKTITSPVLNTGVSGTAVLDEDNMTSNSATQLATQQSIKAFTEATSTAMAIALG